MTRATIPITLNDERFTKAWEEWLEYRRERHLPKLLPRSVQKQWDKLSEFGVEIACAAIDQSIANGWTGLFPDKVRVAGATIHSNAGRASLGSLQIELKRTEDQLNDIFNPGGSAFPRPIPEERKPEFNRLLERRASLKRKIEEFTK